MDDHSRYAYVEALADERGATAAAFLVRALAHFERQSIAVERIGHRSSDRMGRTTWVAGKLGR